MKDSRVLIGILGFLFIVIYTLIFNQNGFCYDEPYYIANVSIIKNVGMGKGFLQHISGPAGPLYGYIQYALSPLTHVHVRPVRMVNIILGGIIVFILFKILSVINPQNKNTAFLLFAIPMAYPTMGMALTEIPAIIFLSVSLLFLLVVYNKETGSRTDLLFLLVGGLAFSAAILGRQPYLLCLGGFVILPFLNFEKQKKIGAILFIISALAIPCYVFSVWHGLVPNNLGGAVVEKSFLSPLYIVLGCGYGAMILFLLAPSFFLKLDKKLILLYLLIFFAVIPISMYLDIAFTPMKTFSEKILPHFMTRYYGYIMFSLICTVALFFVHSLAIRMKENNKNFNYLLISLMLLAVIFSCGKITHQFSSRYVFQAAPFFLILASFHYKNDRYTKTLNIIGLVLGMVSLVTYC